MEESELKTRRESELNGFHTPEIRFRRKSRSSYGYTSLRDLLPSSSETIASSSSPADSSSWNEVPIKNQLVKHAAMAYLQPMSAQTTPSGKSFLARLRDTCFSGAGDEEDLGCASWLCDAISRVSRGLFGYGKREIEEDEDTEVDDVTNKLDENLRGKGIFGSQF